MDQSPEMSKVTASSRAGSLPQWSRGVFTIFESQCHVPRPYPAKLHRRPLDRPARRASPAQRHRRP
ncbi:hypothetical protein DKY63_10555 [Pseudomonas putida]|uniref:Uncharacterized protein n=1 Tax=Pseudomonas putida TaxID=303 RepID=A0A2Z4RGN3_PSEPU|nr:hypothetical protein DKY63_10555 [Pseudomonas putida]